MPLRAFIFDLDGVLLDNERTWTKIEANMYREIFGPEIFSKLPSTVGVNMHRIHEMAVEAGSTVDFETLEAGLYSHAPEVYQQSPITPGLDRLGAELVRRGVKIGIVSASPADWIAMVVERLTFAKDINLIISLHERDDLPHKPAPHGYLEAMKVLEAEPQSTMILEDSNSGIAAAKASGAFTIGLRANLVDGYRQTGADAYADTIDDVLKLLDRRD